MYELSSLAGKTTDKKKKALYSRFLKAFRNSHKMTELMKILLSLAFGELRTDDKYAEVGMKESVFYRKTRAQ